VTDTSDRTGVSRQDPPRRTAEAPAAQNAAGARRWADAWPARGLAWRLAPAGPCQRRWAHVPSLLSPPPDRDRPKWPATKKADASERLEAFDRVGLLFDGSPGTPSYPSSSRPTFSTHSIQFQIGKAKGIFGGDGSQRPGWARREGLFGILESSECFREIRQRPGNLGAGAWRDEFLPAIG
jgi:hypothetical protein